MNINEVIDMFKEEVSEKLLRERLTKPFDMLGNRINDVIPSHTMREAGPVIASLFLICGNLICEARMLQENFFDVARCDQFINKLFTFSVQTYQKDGKEIKAECIVVTIRHNSDYFSEFTYLGDSESGTRWLKKITDNFPNDKIIP